MPYDKLSVVVSVILICLALFLVVELPTETVTFAVRGLPLTITFHLRSLAAAMLVGMACVGAASIMRLHPLPQESSFPWILPGLATLLATILLPRSTDRTYLLIGLAATGALLLLVITAEYRAVDPAASGYSAAQLGINFIAYLIALGLFALIHESQAPGLLMATATLLGSSLLGLELLRSAQQGFRRTALYSLIVGLVMGETAWALSYSTLNSLTAGILLLLVFYVMTGLARQEMLTLLSRRILIEFAVVALIGLALLLKYAP